MLPILIPLLSLSLISSFANSKILSYTHDKQFSPHFPHHGFSFPYKYKFIFDTFLLLPSSDEILLEHDEVLAQLKSLKNKAPELGNIPNHALKYLLHTITNLITNMFLNFKIFPPFGNVPKLFLSLSMATLSLILLLIVPSPCSTPTAKSLNVSFSIRSPTSMPVTLLILIKLVFNVTRIHSRLYFLGFTTRPWSGWIRVLNGFHLFK